MNEYRAAEGPGPYKAARTWKREVIIQNGGRKSFDFLFGVAGIMTIARDWKWEKNYLSSPVTSVEFVGSDLVLSG